MEGLDRSDSDSPGRSSSDGTVKSHQKISDTEGGFTGTLDDRDSFGQSVGSLGDLDDDGVSDLAVGARDDPPPRRERSVRRA